jgi:two-component system alkaline phosphatase synthesis response regulator PhoP
MAAEGIPCRNAYPAAVASAAGGAVAGTVYFIDPVGWSRDAATELRGAGFVVLSVPERDAATRLIRRRPPDHLVLVDPHGSADTPAFVQDLVESAGSPVTVVADGENEEQLLGTLEAGAADVVPLDCRPNLLLARIRAVLRRTGGLPPRADEPITLDDVTLGPGERCVRTRGGEVHLTPIETAVLHLLMQDAGVVYTRGDLLDAIWGSRDQALERTIDAHIWKLRRKIEPQAGQPQYIYSVQGLGYRFRRPEAAGTRAG